MTTRQNRITDFNNGERPVGKSLELLCERIMWNVVVPFACRWTNGAWFGVPDNHLIQITVLGLTVRRRDPAPKHSLSALRWGTGRCGMVNRLPTSGRHCGCFLRWR